MPKLKQKDLQGLFAQMQRVLQEGLDPFTYDKKEGPSDDDYDLPPDQFPEEGQEETAKFDLPPDQFPPDPGSVVRPGRTLARNAKEFDLPLPARQVLLHRKYAGEGGASLHPQDLELMQSAERWRSAPPAPPREQKLWTDALDTIMEAQDLRSQTPFPSVRPPALGGPPPDPGSAVRPGEFDLPPDQGIGTFGPLGTPLGAGEALRGTGLEGGASLRPQDLELILRQLLKPYHQQGGRQEP